MSVISRDAELRPQALEKIVRTLGRHTLLRNVLAFCLFGIAFAFAYHYGMSFGHATSAPFWIPDSILLCALLLARPRWWAALLLATLPIRLLVAVPPDTPLWFLAGTFAIDCVKAVIAALLLRRFSSDPIRFGTVQDLGLYCLVAVFLVPASSAFAGAAARAAIGDDYWSSWQQWFYGAALASLIVTPVIFYWVLRPPRPRQLSGWRRVEAILLTPGLLVSAWLTFEPPSSDPEFADMRLHAPIAFLFWAAIRFGMHGATGAIAVLTFFAVVAARSGRGPFAGQSPNDAAASLQQFLLLWAAPPYLVAVLIEHARRIEQSLRESERGFRYTAGNAPQEAALPDSAQQRQRWACHAILDSDGRLLELQAFGHDNTDRERAEAANRKLAHAARLAALGELTAMIAHQINQPLAAILLNAEAAALMLKRPNPPLAEIRQILADICENDLRAGKVIRGVRALIQQREMQLQPVDLNQMIADVLRLAAGDALCRRVQLCHELSTDLPLASADRVYLEQVLLNLITNGMDAMKDAPESSRQLTVQTRCTGAAGVEVAVIDRGHGIPEASMPHVFDSFFTTKADGTGLGLSIARSIIQAHQGRIWAENGATGGAVFRFTVPAAPVGSQDLRA
jgi:signal transduction histidine kinase